MKISTSIALRLMAFALATHFLTTSSLASETADAARGLTSLDPTGLSFDGRAYRISGSLPSRKKTKIRVQVLSPGPNGSYGCVLLDELVPEIDLSQTHGYFSTILGQSSNKRVSTATRNSAQHRRHLCQFIRRRHDRAK